MKYITASAIYLASFGLYLSLSGAPVRVHFVSALGLLVGFFIPAILVGNRKELKEKKNRIFGLITMSVITLSYLNLLVIGKAEFIAALIPMLTAGTIGLGALILIHTFVTELLTRKGRTSRWYSTPLRALRSTP